MAVMQRRKGRVAQTELRHLLEENDWQVIDTSSGQAVEDMVVQAPYGTMFSCECKAHKNMNLGVFLKQAREQAKKRKIPWMLCCRLPEFPRAWLVLRAGLEPVIWLRRELSQGRA